MPDQRQSFPHSQELEADACDARRATLQLAEFGYSLAMRELDGLCVGMVDKPLTESPMPAPDTLRVRLTDLGLLGTLSSRESTR